MIKLDLDDRWIELLVDGKSKILSIVGCFGEMIE